jgi:hypothetical protein
MATTARWASAIVFSSLIAVAPAHAALDMTVEGQGSSSILQIHFTGSALASLSGSTNLSNIGWDFSPLTFDPFPAGITGGDRGFFRATAGDAWLRNLSTGRATQLIGVWFQDSSNSPEPGMERFGALTVGTYQAVDGDHFEWYGTLTVDLSPKGLTFGDLSPGSTGRLAGGIVGIPASLTVSAVPEPASAGLMLLGGACLVAMRRRPSPVRPI